MLPSVRAVDRVLYLGELCPSNPSSQAGAAVSATAVAEFEGVSKVYRLGLLRRTPIRAVADVTFRVETGEVFGLLGPNRAGKTTLVKLLLALCRPTAGRVTHSAAPPPTPPRWPASATSTRTPPSRAYWNAAGLLEYYGAMTLMDEPTVRKRAGELLQRVGLSDRCHEPIAGFSKGMVQRLGLAQAILNEPDLLVLDEPAEGSTCSAGGWSMR